MKKFITMMLMSASVLFFACDKDEESTLSPVEAKTKITQLATDLGIKMEQMQDAEGLEAIETLNGLSGLFETITPAKSTPKESSALKSIQKYSSPINYINQSKSKSALQDDDPFNFALWVGTWTWDNVNSEWDRTTTPTDKIIVKFPTDTSHLETNDATLTIYKFNDIAVTKTDSTGTTYTAYEPTEILLDLVVGTTKLIDLDITATWNTTSQDADEPITLDAKVYLLPFNFTVNINNTDLKQSIDFAIDYNDVQVFSAGVGMTKENVADTLPANINGYLQLFEVKFEANIDVKALFNVIATEGSTIDDLNRELNAKVYVNGAKAADIQLALKDNVDTESDELPFDILFVYTDGSSEPAMLYFEEIWKELDEFFDSLDEYYGEW